VLSSVCIINLFQMGKDTLHNEAKLLNKMIWCRRHSSIFRKLSPSLSYTKKEDLEECEPIIE
jgi:hypothetical protein